MVSGFDGLTVATCRTISPSVVSLSNYPLRHDNFLWFGTADLYFVPAHLPQIREP
jgi:hypothetical protein